MWHVLVDLPPTVLGEIALKWLEMLQTGLPMNALSALVGPLRLPLAEKLELMRCYVPWAVVRSYITSTHNAQHSGSST